jgi:hypothetical protein
MVLLILVLCYMVVFHVMARLAFHQVEAMCDFVA